MAYLGRTREPVYFYNASQETIELAKRLRKQTTSEEKKLWEQLRGKRIAGMKFRRQHPIGFYIADFYCHEARFVIEVDGMIHSSEERKNYDENRNAEMDRLGIHVVRFTNKEVNECLNDVVKAIEKEIKKGMNIK